MTLEDIKLQINCVMEEDFYQHKYAKNPINRIKAGQRANTCKWIMDMLNTLNNE